MKIYIFVEKLLFFTGTLKIFEYNFRREQMYEILFFNLLIF
jgi:hypothetical protein